MKQEIICLEPNQTLNYRHNCSGIFFYVNYLKSKINKMENKADLRYDLRYILTHGLTKNEVQHTIDKLNYIIKIEGVNSDEAFHKAYYSFRVIRDFMENSNTANKIDKITKQRFNDAEFLNNNTSLLKEDIEMIELSISNLKDLLQEKEAVLKMYKEHFNK